MKFFFSNLIHDMPIYLFFNLFSLELFPTQMTESLPQDYVFAVALGLHTILSYMFCTYTDCFSVLGFIDPDLCLTIKTGTNS